MLEVILNICCDDIKGVVNSGTLISLYKLFQNTTSLVAKEIIYMISTRRNTKSVYDLPNEITYKKNAVIDLDKVSVQTGQDQQHCLNEKNEQIHHVREKLEMNYTNYEENNMNDMIGIGDKITKVRYMSVLENINFSVSYAKGNKIYRKLQELDTQEEASMHNQNLKLHNQIAEFIIQYDTKGFAHQANLDKLTQKCEDSAVTYQLLMIKVKTQESVYRQCLYEKEIEETHLFQAKLYRFQSMRAVKILQRAWRVHRAYLKRKRKKRAHKKQANL